MVHAHPYGKPENVLSFSNDKKVIINDEPLKQMLDHPNVKNRKIVAFSIIGAYRRGKSFFLDYCLRFLYANYQSINNPNEIISNLNDWMGDEDEGLKGFSWRSGSSRDTTGVMIWNDVFLHTDSKSGEKIAIIVLDTQGLFDNETTPMDNSRIFALGTLISSIQVLNLSNVIQEDQIQYLQFATEFAKFAALDNQDEYGKSFQNLLFLIRDWQFPCEFDYGVEGGEKYLANFLQVIPEQEEELKSVRQFIHDSFEKLSCALLPNPGKIVSGGKKSSVEYDGNWGKMDEDFKDELETLIESLLSPDNLVIKKINGKELTCSEYHEYVNQYFTLFQSEKLPGAKSIYETTIEKQMEIIIDECIDDYKQTISKSQNFITTIEQIQIFHDSSKNKAIVMFDEAKKMGNNNHASIFRKHLVNKIEKIFAEWSDVSSTNINKINEEKERVRKALEEKRKIELEEMENRRIAAEKLAALERENARKEMERQEILRQREIAERQLQAEHERRLRIELERYNEEQQRLMYERIEEEKRAAERRARIERENVRLEMERIQLAKEKQLAEMRLEAERERVARLEAEQQRENALRQRQEAEARERAWRSRRDSDEFCSIM